MQYWYNLRWFDWLGVFGLLLTLAGLVLTWLQARNAVKAARAAEQAITHTDTSAIIAQASISTYELRVLNSAGTVVATLGYGQLERGSGKLTTREPAPWNRTLEKLFTAARMSALNPVGVIDKMLDDLGEQD